MKLSILLISVAMTSSIFKKSKISKAPKARKYSTCGGHSVGHSGKQKLYKGATECEDGTQCKCVSDKHYCNCVPVVDDFETCENEHSICASETFKCIIAEADKEEGKFTCRDKTTVDATEAGKIPDYETCPNRNLDTCYSEGADCCIAVGNAVNYTSEQIKDISSRCDNVTADDPNPPADCLKYTCQYQHDCALTDAQTEL